MLLIQCSDDLLDAISRSTVGWGHGDAMFLHSRAAHKACMTCQPHVTPELKWLDHLEREATLKHAKGGAVGSPAVDKHLLPGRVPSSLAQDEYQEQAQQQRALLSNCRQSAV